MDDALAELWVRSQDAADSADAATLARAADCILVALTEAAVSRRVAAHARIAEALGRTGAMGLIAARAYLVHARNSDDAYAVAAHPGAAVVPVALAEAEGRGLGGADALHAVVAGYEAGCHLADVFLPRAAERGWRITSVIAPVAAAATVACLAGLDDDSAASALRVAASTTGGPLETVAGRGDDYRVQPAIAATQGLLAAHAAEGGLAGTIGILEGPQGPFTLICGETWPGWPALGRRPRLQDVTFKRHEGAMYAQAIFDALGRMPSLTGEITRIDLRVPSFALGYSQRSADNEGAPASVAGATRHALAALHPNAHAGLVAAADDDAVGRFGAVVRVELRDGRTFEQAGDGDTSAWSSDDVDAVCRSRLGDDALIAAVRALEDPGGVGAVEAASRAAAGHPQV